MAKTGIQALAEGRADLFKVDPHNIFEKADWNVRSYDSDEAKSAFEQLVLSIISEGVKQPLTVYLEDGKLYLSDGHRRLRAALEAIKRGAEIKTVPAQSEDRYANEGDRLFGQITRNSGLPFTPLENSLLFRRLIDYGFDEPTIAKRAGLSVVYVRQLLELNAAPSDVRQMVAAGEVSATMASSVLKKAKDGKTASMVLKAAVEHAKAAGKSKATAKHVRKTEPLPTAKPIEMVADIIKSAGTVETPNKVTLVISKADHKRLLKILKIKDV